MLIKEPASRGPEKSTEALLKKLPTVVKTYVTKDIIKAPVFLNDSNADKDFLICIVGANF